MKQKIMEVILSANNSLTQEEVSWAIRNIPNQENSDTTDRTSSRTFDHDADDVFSACGFTKGYETTLNNELKLINDQTPSSTKSTFIENILNNASADLRDYLIVRGLIEICVTQDPLDKLRDILKKL
jgi:ribonucleotide reductase beta subunit family protein with ferritin-like domain